MGGASDFIDAGFDFIIGQPPCTFLCNAGVVWLHRDPNRFLGMHRGAKFFKRLLDTDATFVALENPAMHRYATAAIGAMAACDRRSTSIPSSTGTEKQLNPSASMLMVRPS